MNLEHEVIVWRLKQSMAALRLDLDNLTTILNEAGGSSQDDSASDVLETACRAWWDAFSRPGFRSWDELVQQRDGGIPRWRARMRAALEAIGVLPTEQRLDKVAELERYMMGTQDQPPNQEGGGSDES